MICLDNEIKYQKINIKDNKKKWVKSYDYYDTHYVLDNYEIIINKKKKYATSAELFFVPNKDTEERFFLKIWGEAYEFIKKNKTDYLFICINKPNFVYYKKILINNNDDGIYINIGNGLELLMYNYKRKYTCRKNVKLKIFFVSEDGKIGYDDYRIIFYIDNLKLNIRTRNIFTNY